MNRLHQAIKARNGTATAGRRTLFLRSNLPRNRRSHGLSGHLDRDGARRHQLRRSRRPLPHGRRHRHAHHDPHPRHAPRKRAQSRRVRPRHHRHPHGRHARRGRRARALRQVRTPGTRILQRLPRAPLRHRRQRARRAAEAQHRAHLLAQIETGSPQRIEEIASVPDVDIFIGPADLAASLGIPGQTSHPDLLQAAEHIVRVSRKHGKKIITACAAAEFPTGCASASISSSAPTTSSASRPAHSLH